MNPLMQGIKVSAVRAFLCTLIFVLFSGCSAKYPNQRPLNQTFPSVQGQSLSGVKWRIPEDMQGEFSILLIGYKQDAQFDIDRWMLGLDVKGVKAPIFELPVIKGFWPGLFAEQIDSGMRSGIPDELWKIVITLYKESEPVVAFLGNDKPLNARVLVLDKKSRLVYLHDRGFSIQALNQLIGSLPDFELLNSLCPNS